MRIEATTFKVKKDKIDKAREMLKMLNDRKEECIQTLYREKMYVEVIFSEVIREELFLTWFSIQGEHGADVTTSTHLVDKDYLEYWSDCVDRSFKPVNKIPELTLMLPEVGEKIKEVEGS